MSEWRWRRTNRHLLAYWSFHGRRKTAVCAYGDVRKFMKETYVGSMQEDLVAFVMKSMAGCGDNDRNGEDMRVSALEYVVYTANSSKSRIVHVISLFAAVVASHIIVTTAIFASQPIGEKQSFLVFHVNILVHSVF